MINKLSLMKRTSVAILIFSLMVPLLSIGTAQACWWRKPLRANMNLSLLGRPVEPGEPGYDPYPDPGDFPALLTWDGSISGGINGKMHFFLINYQLEGENEEWGHFWEIWQIWDDTHTTLLMEGCDEGYTYQPTGKYAMVGRVTYTSPEFARWKRHIVFMHGTIDWAALPPVAPGTFYVF